MPRKPRRYPPKNGEAQLAAKYYDKATGDLILLYQIKDPTIVVRVPKAELSDPDVFKRKRRKKEVV
jgi:hypothetical protein